MPNSKEKITSESPRQESVPEPLLVPVTEAARRLNLHPASIRHLVRRGELSAKKISPTKWLVNLSSVKKFASAQ